MVRPRRKRTAIYTGTTQRRTHTRVFFVFFLFIIFIASQFFSSYLYSYFYVYIYTLKLAVIQSTCYLQVFLVTVATFRGNWAFFFLAHSSTTGVGDMQNTVRSRRFTSIRNHSTLMLLGGREGITFLLVIYLLFFFSKK